MGAVVRGIRIINPGHPFTSYRCPPELLLVLCGLAAPFAPWALLRSVFYGGVGGKRILHLIRCQKAEKVYGASTKQGS